MMCIPVESRSDQSHVIALFCAFNKRNSTASSSGGTGVGATAAAVGNSNSASAAAAANAVTAAGIAAFDPSDEIKANNTFRYTTTVLTSTIAYQKERRLKMQTETMLNVAKNLFSQLG